MPGYDTALQLVDTAMDLVGTSDTFPYRKGFSDDPDTSEERTWLSLINIARSLIVATSGCSQATQALTLSNAANAVDVSAALTSALEVIDVYTATRSLNKLEGGIPELQAVYGRDWRTHTGDPTHWVADYFPWITYYPKPVSSTSATAIVKRGAAALLVNKTDTVTDVPEALRPAIPLLAGILFCAADGGTSRRQQQAQTLTTMFSSAFPELVKLVQTRGPESAAAEG